MEDKVINIAIVVEVAQALQPLNEQVVFVGGAVVSLYADDPAADEVRPTADVDLTLKIANLSHWENTQQQLAQIGIHPDPNGPSVCRYLYKDIPIDIMATENGPFGPANRWYKLAFDNLWKIKIQDQTIQILPAPCYLATKFEAFNDRGKDYRTSTDFEDIIYILDNRITIVEEIQHTLPEIKKFLQKELQILVDHLGFDEALVAQIHPYVYEQRAILLKEKIDLILNL